MIAPSTQVTEISVSDALATRAEAREHGPLPALNFLASRVPPMVIPQGYLIGTAPIVASIEGHFVGSMPTPQGELFVIRGKAQSGVVDTALHAADRKWRYGVAWIRLGSCERFLADAIAWLRDRTIGGEQVTKLAPIRLAVADATLAQCEAEALLALDTPPTAARFDAITRSLDQSFELTLSMWGAEAFVDGTAAKLARVIDLLGHASGYLPKGSL